MKKIYYNGANDPEYRNDLVVYDSGYYGFSMNNVDLDYERHYYPSEEDDEINTVVDYGRLLIFGNRKQFVVVYDKGTDSLLRMYMDSEGFLAGVYDKRFYLFLFDSDVIAGKIRKLKYAGTEYSHHGPLKDVDLRAAITACILHKRPMTDIIESKFNFGKELCKK